MGSPVAPWFAPPDAQPDTQLTLGHVDDELRALLADPRNWPPSDSDDNHNATAQQSVDGDDRAALARWTVHSGNDPLKRVTLRPFGQRGTRADNTFTPPTWWKTRIPSGWRPADRVEALALWDEIELALGAGHGSRRGWYTAARTWRRQLYRLWVLHHLTPQTNTLAGSIMQLCAAYLQAYGAAISPAQVRRFRTELRTAGFAVVVECAAGLPATGPRAATYALLVPAGQPPTQAEPENVNPQQLITGDRSSVSENIHYAREGRNRFDETDLWTTPLTGSSPAVWRQRKHLVRQLVDRYELTCSAHRLTRALAKHFDHGWTGYALRRGLEHDPQGHLHPSLSSATIRNIPAVMLYRLALHRHDDTWTPPRHWVRNVAAERRRHRSTPPIPSPALASTRAAAMATIRSICSRTTRTETGAGRSVTPTPRTTPLSRPP